MEFTFHKNGETLTHLHIPFTQILFMTYHQLLANGPQKFTKDFLDIGNTIKHFKFENLKHFSIFLDDSQVNVTN